MEPKRSSGQLAAAFFGFVMMAVSSPCIFAMIHDLIVGSDNLAGALIVGSFCTIMAVAGVLMMFWGLKKPKPLEFSVNETIEREVLGIAQRSGGRLTVAELALGSKLDAAGATIVLEHFEHRGVARTHLSNAGDIIYVFPGLTVDKAAAIDPLDDAAMFDAELAAFEAQLDGFDGSVGDEEDVVLEQPQEAKQEW